MGSSESRIRADRSASFGVLGSMKKGAVEKLVDRLVELGYLFRNMSHEYLLISLTDKGRRASRDELGRHFMVVSGAPEAGQGANAEVLERLKQWRASRANEDAVRHSWWPTIPRSSRLPQCSQVRSTSSNRFPDADQR